MKHLINLIKKYIKLKIRKINFYFACAEARDRFHTERGRTMRVIRATETKYIVQSTRDIRINRKRNIYNKKLSHIDYDRAADFIIEKTPSGVKETNHWKINNTQYLTPNT